MLCDISCGVIFHLHSSIVSYQAGPAGRRGLRQAFRRAADGTAARGVREDAGGKGNGGGRSKGRDFAETRFRLW